MIARHRTWLTLAICTGCLTGLAADWPQWRGPDRNGLSAETNWLEKWPAGDSPKVAWKKEIGRGHACVVVSQGRAYCMGWDGHQDTVYCWDAADGSEIWRQSYPCETIAQWSGPRATPTVADGAVYTLGQWGQLRCWDAVTGDLQWKQDLAASYNPDIDYGFAWSPLLVDDLLILGTGSHGLALRAKDGSFAWGDDGQHGGCVSAVPYTHSGQAAVVVTHVSQDRGTLDLVGVEAKTGHELWRSSPWPESWGAIGVDPIVADGTVFITSAQEYRAAARFSIRGQALHEDWQNKRVAGYTGGCVLWKEHLYLVDSRGVLKCLDWKTGEELWSQRGFEDRGTLMSAAGCLLIQTGTSGELVVATAKPSGYEELRRTRVFADGSATFTAPTLANGRICCRSYDGRVVCLEPGSK
ncbi:MAG: PQQ-binding-like beta-propeller repeat protein [Pirellulales bacterium]